MPYIGHTCFGTSEHRSPVCPGLFLCWIGLWNRLVNLQPKYQVIRTKTEMDDHDSDSTLPSGAFYATYLIVYRRWARAESVVTSKGHDRHTMTINDILEQSWTHTCPVCRGPACVKILGFMVGFGHPEGAGFLKDPGSTELNGKAGLFPFQYIQHLKDHGTPFPSCIWSNNTYSTHNDFIFRHSKFESFGCVT